MTIYLYIKTHNKTNLKYLGQTTAKNPHRYTGSGVYWLRHLEVHGCDYSTEILRECQTREELTEWGLYYSRLWNVVESSEWANLKEEAGSYGNHGPETRAKISAAQKGKKRGPRSPEYRVWIAEMNRKKAQDPEFRLKLSNSLKGKKFSEERIAKLTEAARKKAEDPSWIQKQREISLANRSKPPSQKGIPWWTDGTINKKQIECPGPNWKPGMSKRKV